jgi:hypothetical protein
MACQIKKGRIAPCKGLASVLELDGGRGTRRQGVKLQTIINFKTGKFSREWVVLKSGDYNKTGIVMNYCPFCRESIFEAAHPTTPET